MVWGHASSIASASSGSSLAAQRGQRPVPWPCIVSQRLHVGWSSLYKCCFPPTGRRMLGRDCMGPRWAGRYPGCLKLWLQPCCHLWQGGLSAVSSLALQEHFQRASPLPRHLLVSSVHMCSVGSPHNQGCLLFLLARPDQERGSAAALLSIPKFFSQVLTCISQIWPSSRFPTRKVTALLHADLHVIGTTDWEHFVSLLCHSNELLSQQHDPAPNTASSYAASCRHGDSLGDNLSPDDNIWCATATRFHPSLHPSHTPTYSSPSLSPLPAPY